MRSVSRIPYASVKRALRVVGLCFLLATPGLSWAQDERTPEDAFKKGVELMESKKFKEAIGFFLVAYRAFPTAESVLWNLGLASAEVEDHRAALKYWSALREQDANDWRVIAKLIQAHQALSDFDARDRERAKLFALRKAPPADSDIARADVFCREQMVLSGRKVFAFEKFEPKGERMVFYEFVVVEDKDKDKEEFRISLGSYEATNRISWETGKLARDKRLYHLDRYQGPNHWTFGFYDAKPSYDKVRAQVVDILSGRTQPLSSTTAK
jgi:tetratricopeptide (TPR) repeat protein